MTYASFSCCSDEQRLWPEKIQLLLQGRSALKIYTRRVHTGRTENQTCVVVHVCQPPPSKSILTILEALLEL